MNLLSKLNKYLSVIEDNLIKISGISLFIVMILTSFQILSRVAGYPWPGYLELSEFRKTAGKPVWDAWVDANKDKFDAQALLDLIFETAKK